MEYTRFPRAADEPPRADALRGLIEASSPPGQGRPRQRYIARRKSGFLFQGVSHIPIAWRGYLYRLQRFAILFESIRFTLFIYNLDALHRCLQRKTPACSGNQLFQPIPYRLYLKDSMDGGELI